MPVDDIGTSLEDLVKGVPEEIMSLADYKEDSYIGEQRRQCRGTPQFTATLRNIRYHDNETLTRTNN